MQVGQIIYLHDLEDAKLAFDRVQVEIDAQDPNNLTAQNVDMVSATSTAIGVAQVIAEYRDRAAKLPEYEIRSMDRLVDYAKATWYLHITNLPTVEPPDAAAMQDEVVALRAKLLMWAAPLAAEGKFNPSAVDQIRDGAGIKDSSGDLVSLVTLFRSKWDEVRTMCGVTEQDLQRAAVIGPAVFAMVSRRENAPSPTLTNVNLKVRQSWTLLDRAYQQCRRAITYFRFVEGDADTIAPNLRRNVGRRTEPDTTEDPTVPTTTTTATTPAVPATPAMTSPAPTGPIVGGGSGPFIK